MDLSALSLRTAAAADAGTVATLHADSWRRFYRTRTPAPIWMPMSWLIGGWSGRRDCRRRARAAHPSAARNWRCADRRRRPARSVIDQSDTGAMYLWVLEQNVAAQAFYAAHGGRPAEQAMVGNPGGEEGRLVGQPAKLRYVWPDVRDHFAR